MEGNKLKISNVIIWVTAYFGIMLFYTFLNVAVWRKAFPDYSEWFKTLLRVVG